MSAFALGDPRWQRHLILGDGWRIFVRPIRPDDEHFIRDLLAHVSKEDLRLRFFDSIKEFSDQFIAGLTQIDYARAMAFVAFDEASNDILGVVRVHFDKTKETGEYAILLRSDLKGRGLGWALMQLIIEYAKSQGLRRIDGQSDSPGKCGHAENVPGIGIQGQDGYRGPRRVRRYSGARRSLIGRCGMRRS